MKLEEDVRWDRLATPRSKRKQIYLSKHGLLELGLDPRFTVDKTHSYSLVIYNVTVNDSARYQCVEDHGYGNQHFYRLTVEGDSEFDFSSSVRSFLNSISEQIILFFLSEEIAPFFLFLHSLSLALFRADLTEWFLEVFDNVT